MLEVARPFMSGRDYQEAEEVARMMPQLVATVMTQEREEELQAAVRVSGLPKVDRLLSELLDREIQRETRASAQADQWRRFEHLSREDGNPQEAKVTLEALLEDHHNDADRLNNIAWALLTEDGYGDDYLAIATRLAVRACELTDNGHWAYLDTLALAHFKAHDVEGALRLQRRAVELQPDRPDLRQALQRYESAAGEAR
jgi:tetratricopeptide (TPR) repeat protein